MTSRIVLPAILLSTMLWAPPGYGQADSATPTEQRALTVLGSGLPKDLFSGERRPDVLLAQVLLDRAEHSPGVIDGHLGGNTRRAIRAYREAKGLEPGNGLDSALLDSLVGEFGQDLLRRYTITPDDADGPFRTIPSSFAAQAELPALSYENPAEKLAEAFHMSQRLLRALNPDAGFGKAGTDIWVISTGESALGADVARIEIGKARSSVRALAADGTVLATYPATIGSDNFPSPSGTMEVRAVAPEATYHFDPEGRSWGPDSALTIAAGPNNPVGGIWIDLSKEGYGIHGTPEPGLIGKTGSHGCVRLTNWDAEQLAGAVGPGVTVEFV